MIHKILMYKSEYTSLARKKKFSCNNIIVLISILLLGFTLIGILVYNFFAIAIEEEKLLSNVKKVPSWIHWIWNHNFTNFTSIASTLKSIDKQIIVCYYVIENKIYKYLQPKNIDPHLCTHIIIGFASINNCTINLENNLNIYQEISKLKQIEPDLKIMISVGGGNNESGFPHMVKSHANRKIFIQSAIQIIKSLNFDGLDLDWEFPSWANKSTRQNIHFAQLIYELKKEFNHNGQNLILSAAVAATQAIIDTSYEVPTIAEHIDFVNLMSYDYHFFTSYYPVTDLNSPLYTTVLEKGYLTLLNVNYSAHYWISKGMPREKIVIGIPLYGHSYKLYNSENHNLHAPASGNGEIGELGFVQYTDICQFLKSGAVRVFINDSYVPYAYKGNEWISYDDISSIRYKATWIKFNRFKGAMLFSLNTDDWNATCASNHIFPLTGAVKDILHQN